MRRMIKFILVFIVIIGASMELYLSQPKKLRQVEIPNYEFIKEMIVISPGKADGNVAHLYRNAKAKSYWLRYIDTNNKKVRDIITEQYINPKCNTVSIDNDDKVTFGFIEQE